MTDPTGYLQELESELARAGLPPAHRRRIHAEFADHLECDPAADLGAPGLLARHFADELGTSYARSAAGAVWPVASGLVPLALIAAAPAVVRASRLRPQAVGWTGDLLADMGPLRPAVNRLTGGSINRLAFVLAAGLVIVAGLAGARVDDAYDGIVRGVLEGGAFLTGYAVLGRYLGIRE